MLLENAHTPRGASWSMVADGCSLITRDLSRDTRTRVRKVKIRIQNVYNTKAYIGCMGNIPESISLQQDVPKLKEKYTRVGNHMF